MQPNARHFHVKSDYFFCYDGAMKKKIIFIGGMPTAGKSTIARQVSKHFDIPYISTDQIRLIMQSIAEPKKYPMLFHAETMGAEEYLQKYSAEEIANMEYEQGKEVWLGIKFFIENDWVWPDGCVVEGVGILPSLVSEIDQAVFDVSVLFLSDIDHDRVKNVVYTRGLFDKAKNYGDHVKDKEIDWVKLFDEKVRKDAEAHGYPIIDIKKDNTDFARVLDHLK